MSLVSLTITTENLEDTLGVFHGLTEQAKKMIRSGFNVSVAIYKDDDDEEPIVEQDSTNLLQEIVQSWGSGSGIPDTELHRTETKDDPIVLGTN